MNKKHLNYSIAIAVVILVAALLKGSVQQTFFDHNLKKGYLNQISYFPGDTVKAYFDSHFSLRGELHAKDIDEHTIFKTQCDLLPQTPNVNQPWKNGFKFKKSAEFILPEVPSGVYHFGDNTPLIVKSKKPTDVVVVFPSNTLNAYAASGGKSLYTVKSENREKDTAVSFLRPIPVYGDFVMKTFYRYLQELPYSVKHICDKDMDDYSSFGNCKLIMIIGHNEYWTKKARKNFDAFIANGGHALVLSGNTMWFQVRYLGDKMVCHKRFQEDYIPDSSLKTTFWNDKRLKYPIKQSIGMDFEQGGYGLDPDLGWDGLKILKKEHPLFSGTGLNNGDILPLPSKELDGVAVTKWSSDSTPLSFDVPKDFYSYEVLAYDRVFRARHNTTALVEFQKSKNSGKIINMGSTNWCTEKSFNSDQSHLFRKITSNALKRLLTEND